MYAVNIIVLVSPESLSSWQSGADVATNTSISISSNWRQKRTAADANLYRKKKDFPASRVV